MSIFYKGTSLTTVNLH